MWKGERTSNVHSKINILQADKISRSWVLPSVGRRSKLCRSKSQFPTSKNFYRPHLLRNAWNYVDPNHSFLLRRIWRLHLLWDAQSWTNASYSALFLGTLSALSIVRCSKFCQVKLQFSTYHITYSGSLH